MKKHQLTVDSVKASLEIMGCALFLVDYKSNVLEVAASCGLSAEYLNKGPLSSIRSIGQSLTEGPVAIYDVSDDPRIQYPEAAKKEGIASILAVPIYSRGNVIGSMRVYSAEQWEFTLEDVNFVLAVAQIAGVLIDMGRLYQGQKEFNDVLMEMREARAM
jgi:GAF domain-containing protein